MKMLNIIAVSVTLLTGVSTAYAANPFDAMGGFDALNAISDARYATVQSVNGTEARSLMIDTDKGSLQSRIGDNKFLVNSLAAQGYEATDVVGVDGSGTNLTLYVL